VLRELRGDECEDRLGLEGVAGIAEGTVQRPEPSDEPRIEDVRFVDGRADQMLAEDLGPDVGHALAVPGPRARSAVVHDVGRQERDLRSLHATVSSFEVVRDRSLVDREDGPGVVRVRRVGVVDEPGVEDLVDPGHFGLPRAHPLRRPLHDVKNVQDRRRGVGFDGPMAAKTVRRRC
jgi:hypothetical protein